MFYQKWDRSYVLYLFEVCLDNVGDDQETLSQDTQFVSFLGGGIAW